MLFSNNPTYNIRNLLYLLLVISGLVTAAFIFANLCVDKIWFLSLQPVCFVSGGLLLLLFGYGGNELFLASPPSLSVIWLWSWAVSYNRGPFGGVVGNDSLWCNGGHIDANGYTGSRFYCQVAFGKTFPPLSTIPPSANTQS